VAAAARTLGQVPADVVDAAQRVWVAGLGALMMAQKEGGKLFAALVEQGLALEKAGLTPSAAVRGAAGNAAGAAADVVKMAEDTWEKLQRAFDAQVTAALHRLGVPTRDEMVKLTKKVERLTAAIEALKSRG
jgi:poly(hydroxyalkanoate) granule-associated protein